MSRFAAGLEAPLPECAAPCRILRDQETGAFARIYGFGCNCVELSLVASSGRVVPVVRPPASLSLLHDNPGSYGIPILFPWTGRLSGGRYQYAGRRYTLGEVNGPPPWNDLHGFAKNRPWRFDEEARIEAHSVTTCAHFCIASFSELAEFFPHPCRVQLEHTLQVARLTIRARVTNEGYVAMPFGFGFHPYLLAPPGGAIGEIHADEAADACMIRVAAAKRWNIDRLLAYGTEDVDALVAKPPLIEDVPADRDFRIASPLGGRRFSAVYCGLLPDPDGTVATLLAPLTGLVFAVRADHRLKTLAVYTPPNRSEICIEPWTGPSNGFNLAHHGIEQHGVIFLKPGECWDTWIALELREGMIS